MNKHVKEANRKRCMKVIKNMEKRQLNGYYCESTREAEELVLTMIEDGDMVSWGGSVTLDEMGVKEKLPLIGAESLDVWSYRDKEEARLAKVKALSADVFLMGVNSITMDGKLVNIDGTGNRMAALLFGPKKVIVVAGANKITTDVESGIKRTRREAAPPNCSRLGMKTPCSTVGECTPCYIPDSTSCCHTVVTRFARDRDRIHVILINEELGF